jgi:predicted phage terminase large subunit-like protein
LRTYTEDELALIREFKAAEDALVDPVAFRAWMASSDLLDWVHEPVAHHRVMLKAFQWWVDTPSAKLMIFLPFGSAKTVYSSIQLPLWLWARDPTLSILCSSNTQDFAESLARRRRDAVETTEFSRLSGATLRADSKSVKEFQNTKGGTMRAVGISASCTGFRSTHNICDDPHVDFAQLESRKYRDEIFEWYTGIFRSRLAPGGRELICTTRYSSDDLAGRLIQKEGEDWKVIRIPEVSEGAGDILNRPEGARLWPEFLSEDRLLNRVRNPRLWAGAYMARPISDSGTWLSMADLPTVDRAPEGLTVFAAMDLALSVGKGDFSVIMVFGVDEKADLYVLDVWRGQKAVDDVATVLTNTCKLHKPTEVLADDDNASRVFKTYALDHFRRSGVFAPLTDMPTRGQHKEVRAAAFRGFAKQGRVKLLKADWNAALYAEIEGFPDSSPNDDQVDCLSLAGRRLARMAPGKAPVDTKPEPIRAGVTQDENGQLFTTQSFNDLWASNAPINLGTPRRI